MKQSEYNQQSCGFYVQRCLQYGHSQEDASERREYAR